MAVGIKPGQGELNAALRPIFADIRNIHFVHDDLIIATQSMDELLNTLKDVVNAISKSGLTLNTSKCFDKNKINS